jgi:hypothetical protein
MQLAQYAVVDYLKVFTQFILLASGKFNTTVVIARVIYRRAKEKSNHFCAFALLVTASL